MDEAASGAPALSPEARSWAMAAHLTALLGALVGGVAAFVGPLVIWLLKRDDDPFVAEHARESLNFQLFTLLVVLASGIVAAVVTALTIGLGLLVIVPLAIAAGVAWLVVTIIATMRASNGELYRYPVTIRFIS